MTPLIRPDAMLKAPSKHRDAHHRDASRGSFVRQAERLRFRCTASFQVGFNSLSAGRELNGHRRRLKCGAALAPASRNVGASACLMV
jgi:hypothetical protein